MMNRIAVALFIAAALAAPGAALAQSRVAIVDTQRAVQECSAGVKVQADLKKLQDARQAELEAMQREVKKEKDALDKDASKLKPEQYRKRLEALYEKANDVQKRAVSDQRQMAVKEQELTEPIRRAVQSALVRLATEGNYDVVVERSATPFIRGDIDLTDRIITALNAK